ncbi:hypothetical protein BGZ94_001779 [Podila epigama]|nr:hypothetical protein BGZ94_001779 [Podila epigama]
MRTPISSTLVVDRQRWEGSISELLHKAHAHKESYSVQIDGLTIHIHPNVYSPKYFPESAWYARYLQDLVQPGQNFLEVGVGSGIISLFVARKLAAHAKKDSDSDTSDSDSDSDSGSRSGHVYGVDINPDAVDTTRKNFKANHLRGDIRVSDLYKSLDGEKIRFDYIFWNHPWQYSSNVTEKLRSEKTLDEGYEALKRYIAQGKNHLKPNGKILLGTSCFANLDAVADIAADHGYTVAVEAQGIETLQDGTQEEYYILRLD